MAVRVEQEIPHPVAAVFDAASDPQKQLVWDADMLRSVEAITPGPLGKESRYRGDFKRLGVVEYEYTAFDPPLGFEHRAQTKMGRTWHRMAFEPTASGTRLIQEGGIEATGMGRVLAPMMSTMFRSRFRKIAAALDAYLSKSNASLM
jgi:uncharacterized protein YndB with AHSA1/START domain